MLTFIKKEIDIYTSPSGNKISLDVYEYQKGKEFSTIYLQAGIHGIEIVGIPVLYELMKIIENKNYNYNFICVPICNPLALDSQIMGIQTGYNNIHTHAFNCLNYNRLGNGDNLPLGSAIEANLIKILLKISQSADIIIDLHCSGIESGTHIYVNEKILEMAKLFGIKNILTWSKENLMAFEDTHFFYGKNAFTIELGPNRIVNQNYLTENLQYLINFIEKNHQLAKYNIWNSDLQRKSLYTQYAGIIIWDILVGSHMKSGEQIAHIYTRDGIEKILAPSNGFFLSKNHIHAPAAYQEIARYLEY